MINLPALPYTKNSLEPYISAETVEYHYGKHHQAYVNNLNNLIKETEFADISLEAIILQSSGNIFNNAAQVWNHNFYWNCIDPKGGGVPGGLLLDLINKDFGSFERFKDNFSQCALSTFGSGWCWLVKNEEGSLEIMSTSNAGTPSTYHQKALLTCDVWEHAYYIDYRNRRADYIQAFWQLVHWEFVTEQYLN